MTDETINQLHEAVRMREQLLDEASRLLAAGSGDTSPEYEEFKRLREELPGMSRTPELSHAIEMVRKKTKELRGWLRRADRALGTVDPVDGILDFMTKRLCWHIANDRTEAASCLATLMEEIDNGNWIVSVTDGEDENGDEYDDDALGRLKDDDSSG
jgi:hypothetical protein